MARCTIEFDLPEESNEMNLALRGNEAFSRLFDVDQMCRSYLKYDGHEGNEKPLDFIERIRHVIHEDDLMGCFN